ncbi:MAG: WG repeat-containing protein [Reichenbachiella sp.]
MKHLIIGKRVLLSLLVLTYILASHATFAQQSFNFISEQGKIGLSDSQGNILITPKYDQLGWSTGLNIPMDDVIGYYDQSWGLVSLKDRRVTAAKYYTLEAIHSQLIIGTIKGRFSNLLFYGTINSKGETIIPFKYRSIEPISDLLIVSEISDNKRRFGLFTQSNKPLLPVSFDHIDHYDNDLFIFTDSLGYKGLIHRDGTIMITSVMDSISLPKNGFAKTYQAGRVGLIDFTGHLLHEPVYKHIDNNHTVYDFDMFEIRDVDNNLIDQIKGDTIYLLDDDYTAVVRNGFTEILNQKHEVFYRGYNLQSLQNFNKYLIVEQHGKFDILKADGQAFEPYHFDEVKMDSSYLYTRLNNKWFVYNVFGRRISQRKFDDVIAGSDNLIPVKWNGLWGYLNHKGETALSMKYDSVSRFNRQLAQVDFVGFKSLINQFGKVIGQTYYDSIYINNDNTVIVKSNSRTDLLNSKGIPIFQTYNQLTNHELGYLEWTQEGKVGLVSKTGQIIFEPELDSISPIIDHQYLLLKKDGKLALSNLYGSLQFSFTSRYQEITDISEENVGVKINDKWGFVNLNQQLVIANRYDSIQSFHEGMCAVQINGKWGFVNHTERLIVQPNLDKVSPFDHGISVVCRSEQYGAIDMTGKELIGIKYDNILTTKSKLLIVEKDSKFGVYSAEGKRILDLSYDYISETQQHSLIVKRRGLFGVINEKGLYDIPLKYIQIIERADGTYICRKQGNKY